MVSSETDAGTDAGGIDEVAAIKAGLFDEQPAVPSADIDDMIEDGAARPSANPARAARAAGHAMAAASHGEATKPGESQTTTAADVGGDGDDDAGRPEPKTAAGLERPEGAYRKPTVGEAIRNSALESARFALTACSEAISGLAEATGMDAGQLQGWARAVNGATASYGKHAYEQRLNPIRTPDGKLRMTSYAVGWIHGYAAVFGIAVVPSRILLERAQQLGVSFGEIGERIEYARRMCEVNGYDRDNAMASIARLKEMHLAHSERNPSSAQLPDAGTYYWVSDVDGFSDGWSIATRVLAGEQGEGEGANE